jgi:hypothetical protein
MRCPSASGTHAQVAVHFRYQHPGVNDTPRWTDTVLLVRQHDTKRSWLIDDFRYGGHWSFSYGKGSLLSTMLTNRNLCAPPPAEVAPPAKGQGKQHSPAATGHGETLATQVPSSRKRSPCTGRRVEAARTGHSRESSERSSSRISNQSSIRGGPATAWSAKLMMVVYRFVLRVRSPFSEG